MKANKKGVIFTVLSLALIGAIAFAVVSITGDKSKEIRVAKSFVEKLQSVKIVDLNMNIDNIEFKSVEKSVNKSGINQFTVIGDNIGIDLDNKYNVIGFSQKLNAVKGVNEAISEENAVEIAEKYVSIITSEKFEFKEIRPFKNGEEDSNNYTIAFYKYVKDYPYYDNEIIVNINKATGQLESFSNQTITKVKHNFRKEISSEESKEFAKSYYNSLDIKAQIVNEPLLAVTTISDGSYELSYVVEFVILGVDGKEEKNKLFINAESGEVVNRTTDLIKSSKSK
ncbi:MAG: YcdB/YcdC domain-containing protein [Clostridium sp.]